LSFTCVDDTTQKSILHYIAWDLRKKSFYLTYIFCERFRVSQEIIEHLK